MGNPALREMNAVIFANWFEKSDGLIMVGSPASESNEVHHRMFRLLLTDSGHHMLPTDQDNIDKVASQTKRDVVLFCAKAAARSMEVWPDVQPRVHHCFNFLSNVNHVGRKAKGDWGEGENNNPDHENNDYDYDKNKSDKNNSMNTETKKVHFEDEALPVSSTQPALRSDSEPVLKEGPAVLAAEMQHVSQPARQAQGNIGASSHDMDKDKILEELDNKSPAEGLTT